MNIGKSATLIALLLASGAAGLGSQSMEYAPRMTPKEKAKPLPGGGTKEKARRLRQMKRANLENRDG